MSEEICAKLLTVPFFNAVRVTYAHNNFVEIAADLGILGLIAYYWIFVYIVFDYLKKYKKHSKMRTFLFLVVVVYFINHIGMLRSGDASKYFCMLIHFMF